MANKLFEELGNNGINDMLKQFEQFKSQFKGDPKAQVQQLLDTGRMSQEQFQRLSEMATQIQNIIKR